MRNARAGRGDRTEDIVDAHQETVSLRSSTHFGPNNGISLKRCI